MSVLDTPKIKFLDKFKKLYPGSGDEYLQSVFEVLNIIKFAGNISTKEITQKRVLGTNLNTELPKDRTRNRAMQQISSKSMQKDVEKRATSATNRILIMLSESEFIAVRKLVCAKTKKKIVMNFSSLTNTGKDIFI